MPITIGFWNSEHWSPNARVIARKALARQKRAIKSAKSATSYRGGRGGPTRPITRESEQKMRKYKPGMSRLSRDEFKELQRLRIVESEIQSARQKFQKFSLASESITSFNHVFYCEVEASHPLAQSPLSAGAVGHALCYAYYDTGIPTGLPLNASLLVGWPAASFRADSRVPKGIAIAGSGAGPLVDFYFWHAPSGNNGLIVQQVYACLAALGVPFVLFGDLNAEPDQIQAHGIPNADILRPVLGTRISRRMLDYAVSNVANRFTLRHLHYVSGYDIKTKIGSDHMFMILNVT